jgi:hypothetical protein
MAYLGADVPPAVVAVCRPCRAVKGNALRPLSRPDHRKARRKLQLFASGPQQGSRARASSDDGGRIVPTRVTRVVSAGLPGLGKRR